ncbi:MAG: efflux RND transporter permease subunit [Verrucomicrobiota bacterium]|nr:efflux RND transporter permease subunit [Verrucomicrobiota bacterium]MDQ6938955.1 efflux RND transporter permease subunit [Verrucomicrobiota bacterium]
MKSFTDIFIRRPVLALVVSLVIVIAGVQAISSLNVRQYPRTDVASVTVTTVYVGASAELVRGFITTPLERAIAAADGIDYLQSQSAQGLSTITARLKLNYDSNKALSEISSKVNQVRGDLPPEAQIPVISIASADSQFASCYLSFTSDILQSNEITDYLSRIVQPRLTAIAGVQKADILGGRTFAMRIWLKPDRMAALNVSPAQVRKALGNNNYLAALGSTKGSLVQVNLTANTDLHTVEDFKNLVVREENGVLVRLGDISDVVLGAEDYNTEVRFSGQRAVFMGIFVLPNANSIDVVKRVREEMVQIQKELPTGMQGVIAYDGTAYINTAIKDVFRTLVETLLIVIVVIFLFLGSVRSVLIPVVAIPISLIGAVFLMQIFGFSVNLLTLLAIVLSVGLVVDDAIVVVENVERHLREGSAPLNAALQGARELVGPIIAMTITLAAVYIPIGIQGGLTGTLFREFAFTLAGAVAISGVVALTLSPMMSAKFLRQGDSERGFAGKVNHVFDRIREWYGRHLDATLRVRPAVYAAWIGLTVIAAIMFVLLPTFAAKELAPTEDQGVIFGIMTAPANSTIEQTSAFADAAGQVFRSFPQCDFTFQLTFPSNGFGGMVLKPWDQRKETAFDLMPQVQAKLGTIPGIEMFPAMPPALPGGGTFPVEIVLLSTEEPARMLDFANQIKAKAMESKKFFFPPIIDTKIDQPQAEVVFDHDKVAALGLNLTQVGADMSAMLGGNFVNRFNIAGRSYKVIPQIERSERLNPKQLENIYVTGPNDKLMPLSTVAHIEQKTVPRSLNRLQQLNAVTISGASALPLDQALKLLEGEAIKILPKGYTIDYTGESRQLRVEGDKFLPAFGLAVILIFLVLAAQFNSFRDPFIILLGSVPLALFGAMIFMFEKSPNPNLKFFTNAWTTSFNIYSQVGLVTLVGLISKNGILIVEFANKLQQQGRDKVHAVAEAARTRLRPILMTTIATVAGHMPLVFVTGAGARARNSIGLVLVGGMTIGTIFTLFIVPSLYVLLAKQHDHDFSGVDLDGDNIGDAQAMPEFALADGNPESFRGWSNGNGNGA